MPLLDEFDNKINEFINDQSLDFDNDPDLSIHVNVAKQQSDHIKQLRQEIGI